MGHTNHIYMQELQLAAQFSQSLSDEHSGAHNRLACVMMSVRLFS